MVYKYVEDIEIRKNIWRAMVIYINTNYIKANLYYYCNKMNNTNTLIPTTIDYKLLL